MWDIPMIVHNATGMSESMEHELMKSTAYSYHAPPPTLLGKQETKI